MSWKEANVVSERARFVLEWKRRWEEGQGHLDVAELCRVFGISRQTGYVWIRRFPSIGVRPPRPRGSIEAPALQPVGGSGGDAGSRRGGQESVSAMGAA